MKPVELLKEHCEFNYPYDCYVLLAISRKKDTPEITNSQEIVFREVIKNEKDIIRKYNKIKAQVVNYVDEDGKKFPFYIYVSLNARDSLKATFSLQNKINGWLQETINGVDRSRMFKKVYGHFYSELMRKHCRTKGQKYFMIDFDEKETEKVNDFFKVCYKEGINILLEQQTKNGWHFKVYPFDIRTLDSIKGMYNFEIKKDANIFIEYVKVKN